MDEMRDPSDGGRRCVRRIPGEAAERPRTTSIAKRSLIYFLIVEIKAVDRASVAHLNGIFAIVGE